MLLAAVPDLAMTGKARTAVAGEVPNPLDPPRGCAFHPRCSYANDRCRIERPLLRAAGGDAEVACHAVEEGRIGVALLFATSRKARGATGRSPWDRPPDRL